MPQTPNQRLKLTGAAIMVFRTSTSLQAAPTGGTRTFRKRYQFKSADSITIIGEMQHGEKWVTFMTTRLTRKR